MKKYITYLTIYSGDKLPPFYIGSTSLDRHLAGYHGSVLSKKYKKIYNKELSDNPHLFDSCILAEFNTREEAIKCELYYQRLHDAVKNPLFFNMSYAAPKGSFGRDNKGQNHPLYGSHNCKGNIHSHDPLTGKSAFLPYIPEGYVKGRSNKFKASSHNKGKKWYNNGVKQMLCHEPPGPEWTKGKIKELVSKAAKLGWKRHHENTKLG